MQLWKSTENNIGPKRAPSSGWIEKEAGASLSFDKVLLLSDESGVKVGSPYVQGANVTATVDAELKADKVIVFKYKPKKDYRRTQGHRQRYTLVTVQEIVGA